MGIQYDFYQNPVPKNSNKKPKLHARMKPSGTMNTSQVIELIHEFNSLSTADAKAALEAYTHVMKMALLNGQMVQLDGLGLFSLTLDCPPVDTPDERRAESIHVKSVTFRPAADFLDDFKTADLVRVREKNHSLTHSPEEIARRLEAYFKEHDCITRKEFCQLCGVTFGTAIRRINSLIADGKLRKAVHGVGVYVKG